MGTKSIFVTKCYTSQQTVINEFGWHIYALECDAMRQSDLEIFSKLAKEKYGSDINFTAVETALAHLRVGGAITRADLEEIANPSHWPFIDYWIWPSSEEFYTDLRGSTDYLKNLGDKLDKEETIISNLLRIFRSIDLTSIILRFSWPEHYGIYSRPTLFILGTKRGVNALEEYLNYVQDLRLFKNTFGIERAADVDMIAWALQYAQAKDMDRYKKRLAKAIPFKLPEDDMLLYLRSKPLEIAKAYLVRGDYVTCGKWAGEAAERLLKSTYEKLGILFSKDATIGSLVNIGKRSNKTGSWFRRHKKNLYELIDLRNMVTHESSSFSKKDAAKMLEIIDKAFQQGSDI